jgi:hypothetical protein
MQSRGCRLPLYRLNEAMVDRPFAGIRAKFDDCILPQPDAKRNL